MNHRIKIKMFIKIVLRTTLSERKLKNLLFNTMYQNGGFSYHLNDNLDRGIIEITKGILELDKYKETEEEAVGLLRKKKNVVSVELLETELTEEIYDESGPFKRPTGRNRLILKKVYNGSSYLLQEDIKGYFIYWNEKRSGFPEGKFQTLNRGSVVIPYDNLNPAAKYKWLNEVLIQHAIHLWDEKNATEEQRNKRYFEYNIYHDFYPLFVIPNAELVRVQVDGKEQYLWIDGSKYKKDN